MDYKPNDDLSKKPGSSLPKGKKEVIENMLKNGRTVEETAKLTIVRKQTVVDIRKSMEQEGKLELGSWKKEMTELLGNFALKGAKRLNDEIDNLPLGQVMMAVAIAVDKVRDMSDAPVVKVEARLKISQDDLNKAFTPDSEPIDIIEADAKKAVDNGEQQVQSTNLPTQNNDETTIQEKPGS
jgi:hypothetical protein